MRATPRLLGILNATPDSFSDGGRFIKLDAALQHALQMLDAGASIIDIGGESTRPGSQTISADAECARVLPIITALHAARPDAQISIDTRKAAVAQAALQAGATIINDVSAGEFDSAMLPLAAQLSVPIILMHMRGMPQHMQEDVQYNDVVGEVAAYLQQRAQVAQQAGVPRGKIIIDPGIGFGKLLEHNLALLRALPKLRALGFPLLIGGSRKSWIGQLLRDAGPKDRLAGSLALAIHCAEHEVEYLRVHDVRETHEALSVWREL